MNTTTHKPFIIKLTSQRTRKAVYLKARHSGLRARIVTTRHAQNARGFTLEEALQFVNDNAAYFGYNFEVIERAEVTQ